jgi:excisionase family DNA binding protein
VTAKARGRGLQIVKPRAQRRADVHHRAEQRGGSRPIETPWLSATEVMAYLRPRVYSKSVLLHLIRQHGLPYGRRGRLLCFHRGAVDQWLAGHTTPLPTTAPVDTGDTDADSEPLRKRVSG